MVYKLKFLDYNMFKSTKLKKVNPMELSVNISKRGNFVVTRIKLDVRTNVLSIEPLDGKPGKYAVSDKRDLDLYNVGLDDIKTLLENDYVDYVNEEDIELALHVIKINSNLGA